MIVTFLAEVVCSCGTVNKAALFSAVRVNKNSLRTTDTSIGLISQSCKGCLGKIPVPTRWNLKSEDAAKVDAYRAKHWPVRVGVPRIGADRNG